MKIIKTGTILEDTYQAKRWQIAGYNNITGNLHLYVVKDLKTGMKERELHFATPNYPDIRNAKTEFMINDLNLTFQALIKVLCNNFSFLPEAVEEINYFHPQTGVKQLGFVYSSCNGVWKNYSDQKKNLNYQVKKDLHDLLFKIQNLNKNDYLIQSIPRLSLRRNRVNFRLFWRFLPTAISKFSRNNIKAKNAVFFPNKLYGAPESFTDNSYELSPATDVYALGKFVLQMVLGIKKFNRLFSQNPFPDEVTNILNQTKLNNKLRRFVSIALQPNPRDRFRNMHQVKVYLDGKEDKKIADKDLIIIDFFKKDKTKKYDFKKIENIIEGNKFCKLKLFITNQKVKPDNPFFFFLKRRGYEVIKFENTDKFFYYILSRLKANKLIVVGELNNFLTSKILQESQTGSKIFISNRAKNPFLNDVKTYDLKKFYL